VRSWNHCCSGKAVNITCPECVFVAILIQQVVRMRRILLSSVAFPAVQYSSILSHKSYDYFFCKSAIEHKMCVSIFSTYRVAQNNVYTLLHEQYYSTIVTTVFIQKQN
jgi:hypothetical protein